MATASAATASAETAVVHRTPVRPPVPRSREPLSVRTNANGTRNAGSEYFQVATMVRIGLPPVMAAAAAAASAVGGLTSDSTA